MTYTHDMADEVQLEGKTYISSKRASELTGYAQDYIGQLARGGKIDARRVAGLWYVQAESIKEHQERADAYVPAPHLAPEERAADSITGDDGFEYVSANRASKLSRYHQDYIGQLARSGTIPAQQVGNRWYVHMNALLSHKEQKDSLLAAVQAESVGLTAGAQTKSNDDSSSMHFSYLADERPTVPFSETYDAPVVKERVSDADEWSGDQAGGGEEAEERRINIRVFRPSAVPERRAIRSRKTGDISRKYLVMSGYAVASLLIVVSGYLTYAHIPVGKMSDAILQRFAAQTETVHSPKELEVNADMPIAQEGNDMDVNGSEESGFDRARSQSTQTATAANVWEKLLPLVSEQLEYSRPL